MARDYSKTGESSSRNKYIYLTPKIKSGHIYRSDTKSDMPGITAFIDKTGLRWKEENPEYSIPAHFEFVFYLDGLDPEEHPDDRKPKKWAFAWSYRVRSITERIFNRMLEGIGYDKTWNNDDDRLVSISVSKKDDAKYGNIYVNYGADGFDPGTRFDWDNDTKGFLNVPRAKDTGVADPNNKGRNIMDSNEVWQFWLGAFICEIHPRISNTILQATDYEDMEAREVFNQSIEVYKKHASFTTIHPIQPKEEKTDKQKEVEAHNEEAKKTAKTAKKITSKAPDDDKAKTLQCANALKALLDKEPAPKDLAVKFPDFVAYINKEGISDSGKASLFKIVNGYCKKRPDENDNTWRVDEMSETLTDLPF